MALYYQFGQLFNITFMSDHFGDKVFRYFTIGQVAGDTSYGISGRWCPGNKDNFSCWYNLLQSPFDGATLSKNFKGNLHWNFLFQITDPFFYDYTGLQPLPLTMDASKTDKNGQVQLNYYFFANHDVNLAIRTGTTALSQSASVTNADTMIDQKFYNDRIKPIMDNDPLGWGNTPFALISIIWDSSLWNNAQNIKQYQLPEYRVNFPSKKNSK